MSTDDLLHWGQVPALASGGLPPGAMRRRATDAARRLVAERAAWEALAARDESRRPRERGARDCGRR